MAPSMSTKVRSSKLSIMKRRLESLSETVATQDQRSNNAIEIAAHDDFAGPWDHDTIFQRFSAPQQLHLSDHCDIIQLHNADTQPRFLIDLDMPDMAVVQFNGIFDQCSSSSNEYGTGYASSGKLDPGSHGVGALPNSGLTTSSSSIPGWYHQSMLSSNMSQPPDSIGDFTTSHDHNFLGGQPSIDHSFVSSPVIQMHRETSNRPAWHSDVTPLMMETITHSDRNTTSRVAYGTGPLSADEFPFPLTTPSLIDPVVAITKTASELSGSGNIKCDVCGVEYSGRYRSGNLARHKRHKHNRRSDILLRCLERSCGKVFKRQDARLNHVRIHHPELAFDSISRPRAKQGRAG